MSQMTVLNQALNSQAPVEVFDVDAATSDVLKFGYSNGRLEMYIDDFAAWYYYILPEEVNMIYNLGMYNYGASCLAPPSLAFISGNFQILFTT